MQGGIIDKDMPLPVVGRGHRVPACDGPTRIGYRFDETGTQGPGLPQVRDGAVMTAAATARPGPG